MQVNTIFKIIKKPSVFLRIIVSSGLFNCMSDEQYLKLKWRINMGGKLNIQNPQTFNEKIQWLKLNDRKELYHTLVDKYDAKIWAESIIGSAHIVPNYGVWDSFDEIDFSTLPRQFVLKCTHDSGGLVICRDKGKLDLKRTKQIIEKSFKRQYYYTGREWPYKGIKPRIIAEKFMNDNRTEKTGLTDFKFFCFGGEPKFLYISQGLENHDTAGISFYDLQGKKKRFKRSDYHEIPGDFFSLPPCFPRMVEVARLLAKNVGSPFVRIDLYEIDGDVYFSEVTFSPCSGFLPFEPKSADLELGKLIDLN